MAHPRNLSKSKLLAFRQCPRRLWLEVHCKDLRQDSAGAQASFAVGHTVGDIARRIYATDGQGTFLDVSEIGFDEALRATDRLVRSDQPIFEAGFQADGALAFADILLPVGESEPQQWRMVEVKSSSKVKDYHRDDAAIQSFVARQSGVSLVGIALAHIDSKWVYPGNEDYQGLLKEEDLTKEAFGRTEEVEGWIAAAQTVAKLESEPKILTGQHCRDPFECGFFTHCRAEEPVAEHPVEWIPRVANTLKTLPAPEGVIDMTQVPDDLLNEKQLRVKQCTLENRIHFDRVGAAAALSKHSLPGLFLDFETIRFVVPIWAGTRPYRQIPFQFSLHVLGADGVLSHSFFLDLSGEDPSQKFSRALITACALPGPIFVYSGFESSRIKELAERYPQHREGLLALLPRLVDLLPVARDHYYNPSQEGSWSIKKVLPAMAPELRYDALEGVQDGTAAMSAYLEAISSHTSAERKTEIESQLLTYCRLDTFAMIRVWAVLAGREDMRHLPDNA